MTALANVFAMTKISAQKAAAICADDIAVNTSILQETPPGRRVPAVLKVMGGSLVIKAAMIPLAIGITAFAPWAILPLLAVGGLHLASEGVRNLMGKGHGHGGHSHGKDGHDHDHKPKTPKEIEREKVKNALIVDGILSAEITVLTLSIVAGAPLMAVLGVVAATGAIQTAWMYGLIGGLTNMDSIGKWFEKREGKSLPARAARAVGKAMARSVPHIMKGISLVGTVALFVIGGELVLHGIPGAENMVTHALGALAANPIAQHALHYAAETVTGLVAGIAALPVMNVLEPALGKGIEKAKNFASTLGQKIRKALRPGAQEPKPAAKPAPPQQPPAAPALQKAPDAAAALNKAAGKKPDSTPAAPPPAPKPPAPPQPPSA